MGRYSFAQQTCIKRSGLLLRESGAIWPGCRIGIAVSGGVDSFVLLKVMQIRKGILPFPIEIMALHVNAGFSPTSHEGLVPWLAREGISAHVHSGDFGPLAFTEENRVKSPCFYCASRRRKILFDLCARYGLTHLAFGHNADDLLSTFLLNFCRNGRARTLSACASFFSGNLRVIRPLLIVEKKYIIQASRQWRLPVWENTCPANGRSARSQTGDIVASIQQVLPGARRSMLNALVRDELERTKNALS